MATLNRKQKTRVVVAHCLKALLGAIALLLTFTSNAQTAIDIVKKADDKMRGQTSQAEMVIRTVRATWTRELSVRTWMKGTSYAIILIQAPIKDKGIVFLKRGKEVWNWMPRLERSIKLPPSMMSQSWMGTDFTNDDLVRESSTVIDYHHKMAGDTVVAGRDCHVIEMIPKPDAPVVWSRLVVCIDKKDYIELYTRFYDDDGKLVNTLSAHDVKEMDGRLIPTRLEMIPADKKNQKTEIIYSLIRFNKPIDDRLFTLENIRMIK